MHQGFVTTRPERTSDQIAADRKSATAFFERLSKRSARDRGRLAEHESRYFKLLMAEKEGLEWANRYTVPESERRARRVAATANNPLLNRDDSKLRRYVAEKMRKSMPLPQLHQQESDRRRRSIASARGWRARNTRPSPLFKRQIRRDATSHFEQWLLTHPHYGPEYPAVADTTDRKRFNPAKTVPGQFRPAGTTPERALQIAIEALNKRGGKW